MMRSPSLCYCASMVMIVYVAYAIAEGEKRAPSGFTGVRGKKLMPDVGYVESKETMAEKSRFPEALYQEAELLYKRAPLGFLGMRGKKDMELTNSDDYYKRAPSGFLGMRGKKENDYGFPNSYTAYYEKRAPVGFMGLRGKKETEILADDLKRAPSAGFFGTRGKKQPFRAGFFGTRGKKYPYEFRGKFVGVRGKKTSNEVTGPDYYTMDEHLSRVGQDLDINQLMLLLTESDFNGYHDNNAAEQQN